MFGYESGYGGANESEYAHEYAHDHEYEYEYEYELSAGGVIPAARARG